MRSSIKKLYCTPFLKTYFDFTKTKKKIVKTNKLINNNLSNNNLNKNKSELNKFNSYKYMYSGLIKK